MKTNLKSILMCSIVLLFNFLSHAQYAPTYMSGYDPNFVAVNSTNFSPYGSTGYNNTQKHLATLTNLTLKIQNNLMSYYGDSRNYTPTTDTNVLLNTPAYKYDRIVKSNGIIARKVMYAKKHVTGNPDPFVRMVVVRPDDNVVRPCIMITNGANWMIDFAKPGGYAVWAIIADLAIRGYCVVYYESLSNDLAGLAYILPNQYPCNYYGQGDDVIRKNAYANFQYAVAAYNYILTDASLPATQRIINANTNDISAFGISMGASTAFMLAYSRAGINYTTPNYNLSYTGTSTHTCSNTQISNNNYTKLCLNANPTSSINIKSLILGNSYVPADQDYFTTTPKSVPTLFLWGNEDDVRINGPTSLPVNYFLPPDPASSALLLPFNSVRTTMKSLGILSRLFVNCNGGHLFFKNFATGNVTPLSCLVTNTLTDKLSMLTTSNSKDDILTIGNTIQTTDPSYPGNTIFLNCIDPVNTKYDNQQKYYNYSVDGASFRLFGTQMMYAFSGIIHSNTILTNFLKDIRTNTNITPTLPPNSTPNFVKTNTDFSVNPFYIGTPPYQICFWYRVSSANMDGSIVPSTSCMNSGNTYTRMASPGIEEQKSEVDKSFSLYPNPSDNLLNVELYSETEGHVKVEIYNSTGAIVMTMERSLQLGMNKLELNTKGLPAGMYFVRSQFGGNAIVKTINISH